MSEALYYVETSVISYLANRLSRDLLTSARQTITNEWWENTSKAQLRVSNLVLQEISRGNPIAASKRRVLANSITLLEDHPEQILLAEKLITEKLIPENEVEDALHITQAALCACKFIVTWNFSHFVGHQPRLKLNLALYAWGFTQLYLVTPEELLEGKQNG